MLLFQWHFARHFSEEFFKYSLSTKNIALFYMNHAEVGTYYYYY